MRRDVRCFASRAAYFRFISRCDRIPQRVEDARAEAGVREERPPQCGVDLDVEELPARVPDGDHALRKRE